MRHGGSFTVEVQITLRRAQTVLFSFFFLIFGLKRWRNVLVLSVWEQRWWLSFRHRRGWNVGALGLFFFFLLLFFLQPTRHWNCFHYYSKPSTSPGHYRHQLQFSSSLYSSLMILVHLDVLKLKRLLLGKSWVRGFSPLAGVAKRLARYHSLKLCVEWFQVQGLNFWLVHVTAMTRLGSSSPPLLSSLKALTRAGPVCLVVFVLALSEGLLVKRGENRPITVNRIFSPSSSILSPYMSVLEAFYCDERELYTHTNTACWTALRNAEIWNPSWKFHYSKITEHVFIPCNVQFMSIQLYVCLHFWGGWRNQPAPTWFRWKIWTAADSRTVRLLKQLIRKPTWNPQRNNTGASLEAAGRTDL